ncbi:methionyl-tRNA formyltransferase [Planosporangium sp. 12N6]|uniref:methionyl-tRNA formyltransferase n=1 Tax=Planosporangium spinosum TaxID=3402278 RepID=UPI003CED06A0
MGVAEKMRLVLLSHGADDFAPLQTACTRAGHEPVAYVSARSPRPAGRADAATRSAISGVIDAVPSGTDLLLPARAAHLERALAGYRPDLLVCYCFPWKLPASVLRIARLGAINVHSSLLPRYRGPIPVHWAIRNGDREIGVTVHRMDEDFDTGPVVIQKGGIPVAEDAVAERLFGHVAAAVPDLLADALALVGDGHEGVRQDSSAASYAGWMEREFLAVDWTRTADEVHNQVRTFRFATSGTHGPVADVNGDRLEVLRTRTEPSDGIRVECADGPIWIVDCMAPHDHSAEDFPWIRRTPPGGEPVSSMPQSAHLTEGS